MSDREVEIAKYVKCYENPWYRMGQGRREASERVLRGLPKGTLLDVGAGRGELQEISEPLGFDYYGIEPVPYLASAKVETGIATELPFENKSFTGVACLDVLEHLIEADIRAALLEMKRVAREFVFLTASERKSRHGAVELHISKRPKAEWEALFREVFPGTDIRAVGMVGVSPGWVVRF